MLELKNVTKSFNLTGAKEDLRIALDHINLQIESGEFVTIIGGNGSGKSTTMNIITGVVKPDEGKVLLNDVDITKMDEHQRASWYEKIEKAIAACSDHFECSRFVQNEDILRVFQTVLADRPSVVYLDRTHLQIASSVIGECVRLSDQHSGFGYGVPVAQSRH